MVHLPALRGLSLADYLLLRPVRRTGRACVKESFEKTIRGRAE
jgi:hypothetical protein